MENREYINCKIQMKEAWINTGAGVLILEQPIKGFRNVGFSLICILCN